MDFLFRNLARRQTDGLRPENGIPWLSIVADYGLYRGLMGKQYKNGLEREKKGVEHGFEPGKRRGKNGVEKGKNEAKQVLNSCSNWISLDDGILNGGEWLRSLAPDLSSLFAVLTFSSLVLNNFGHRLEKDGPLIERERKECIPLPFLSHPLLFSFNSRHTSTLHPIPFDSLAIFAPAHYLRSECNGCAVVRCSQAKKLCYWGSTMDSGEPLGMWRRVSIRIFCC